VRNSSVGRADTGNRKHCYPLCLGMEELGGQQEDKSGLSEEDRVNLSDWKCECENQKAV